MRELILAIVVGVLGGACTTAPPQGPQVSSCRERGHVIIENAKTCHEATSGLERLVASDPDCQAVFGGSGTGILCDGGRP